ncbi:MAG: S8 family serine peptidase [Gemmatimonadota bacterium]|nr:S8 family serine peptidase [Gemmatimonadota bacterium]
MQMDVPAARSRRVAFALCAVGLAGGCTPSTRIFPSQAVAAAGSSLPIAVSTLYTEEQTLSVALDRIDQRELPLDQTYRHFGSGKGVSIYVFDGGILATHPELKGRVRVGYNAFPDGEHICNAHGTAVAGAAAGTTLGVAPDAEVVDVKMVECRTLRGSIDAIVRGARWMLADHARHPDRRAIANWSFMADTANRVPALDSAIAQLNAAGIPVVVSAGNYDMDACHISPSNSPGAIVVGASRVRRSRVAADASLMDERAPGTAFGPCIDVFAPGDSVLLPSMNDEHGASQQLWAGTSMAAGYVSGAAALYLEAHPRATSRDVANHIRSSSSKGMAVDARSGSAGMLYVGADQSAGPVVLAGRALQ